MVNKLIFNILLTTLYLQSSDQLTINVFVNDQNQTVQIINTAKVRDLKDFLGIQETSNLYVQHDSSTKGPFVNGYPICAIIQQYQNPVFTFK